MLVTELYEVQYGLAAELMNYIFQKREVMYNFRNNSTFETRNIESVYNVSETMYFLGPKMWELLPSKIKDPENLNIFKSNIKLQKPENHLCRVYIADIGFFEL